MKIILKKAVTVYDVFHSAGACVYAEDNFAKYTVGMGAAVEAKADDEAINEVPVAPVKVKKAAVEVPVAAVKA